MSKRKKTNTRQIPPKRINEKKERVKQPSPSPRPINAIQLNRKLGNKNSYENSVGNNDEKTDMKTQTFNEKDLVIVTCKRWHDDNDVHFHVLLDEIDDKNVSVGLSTKKFKGKNHPNFPLKKSPFDDGETSYMRRQGTVAKKNSYFSEKKGTMTKDDYKQAKIYGERAKAKYLRENKKSNEVPNFPNGHQP